MSFWERFELRELVGRGQSETWRAWDHSSSQAVIVKILRLDERGAWKGLELFEREVLTQSQLDHANVPKLVAHDLGVTDSKVWAFAQAYMDGTDLRQAPVDSEAELLDVARGVLEVLAYFQSFSPPVLHRDIKPANILRTSRGVAVVDLGAVQLVTPSDEGGSTIVGTSGYMAPEQLMGRATASSDLYALGMTLVWLVTRQEPESLPVSKMKVVWQNAAVVQVGRHTTALIDALIEPLASKRPASAEDALALLRGTRNTNALVAMDRPRNTQLEVTPVPDGIEIVRPPTKATKAFLPAIGVTTVVASVIFWFASLESRIMIVLVAVLAVVVLGALWVNESATHRLILERNQWRYLIRSRQMARGRVDDLVGLAPVVINGQITHVNVVTHEKPVQIFKMTPDEVAWLNSEIEAYKANMDRS